MLTGMFAKYLDSTFKQGLAKTYDGWRDDDLAFVSHWGFELSKIKIPVLLMHGKQDDFVPFAHGKWLAENIPNAEARLFDDDGHLSLFENRIEEIHSWLLQCF